MTRTPPRAPPHLRQAKAWNGVQPQPLTWGLQLLHLAINLFVSLTIVIGCLVPLHGAQTVTRALGAIDAESRFALAVPESFSVKPGTRLPIYRYSPEYQYELGKATVVAAEPGRLECRADLDTFTFPIGRHGVIVGRDERQFTLDLGAARFEVGDHVQVFDRVEHVGELRLVKRLPSEHRWVAVSERAGGRFRTVVDSPDLAPQGFTVSEYNIATTAKVFSYRWWIVALELLALAIVVGMELHFFYHRRIGMLAVMGRSAVNAWRRLPPSTRQGGSLVFALVASSVLYSLVGLMLAKFPLWITYRLGKLPLHGLQVWAAGLPSWTGWALAGAMLVAHVVFLEVRGKHLPLWIWEISRYHPRRLESSISDNPRVQATIVWALHLVVFYAFAYALVGGLAGNMNTMYTILAERDDQLRLVGASLRNPESIPAWLLALFHNVGVIVRDGLAPMSVDHWFAVVRLMVWSITITGCLVGYLNSVLVPLHYTRIRNIDFTLMGWVVNGICYGALLGGLWHMVTPPLWGSVPSITQGPLYYATLIVELGVNVLYTASILSMGTKFGVMVDKGLVDWGFFRIIRHPSYGIEWFMFFLLSAKTLESNLLWLGALLPFLHYYLRSERDEAFMRASNPDYRRYRRQVRYKYVYGLV